MERKTIYVIGAGASNEAGLPTGNELKSIISSLLDIQFDWDKQKSGDRQITEALKHYVRKSGGNNDDLNEYFKEAWHIKDALPQAISIDNFIDAHKGNERLALCGKLSIVRSILNSEKSSLLHFKRDHVDSTINFSALDKTWYLPFFQLITENCRIDDLEKRLKSITLIIFNYDRCIEHYLFHSLINYYRIKEEKASEKYRHPS